MGGDGVAAAKKMQDVPSVIIPPSSSSVSSSSQIHNDHESVLLGVQELERQIFTTSTSTVRRENPFASLPLRDDDTSDTTGGSSFPASLDGPNTSVKRSRSLKKFITTPLKNSGKKFRNFSMDQMNSSKHGNANKDARNNPTKNPVPEAEKSILTSEEEDAVWEPHEVKPLIYGYLHKWGRNCQWQRRWFECDGQNLAYYKNMNRKKLLATLDLSRVGSIALSDEDECTFTIQVSNRHYQLCAENAARAQDWVISLNRTKEARLSIGGMSLVHNRNTNEHTQPVVQLQTQRERLKGYSDLDMDPDFKKQIITHSHTDDSNTQSNTVDTTISASYPFDDHNSELFRSKQLFLTGWTKQGRSTMQRISMRLSRWATRMTRLRCVVQENPVHQPDAYVAHNPISFAPDHPLTKSQAGACAPYPLRPSRSFEEPSASKKNKDTNEKNNLGTANTTRPRGYSDVDEHMVKDMVVDDSDKEDMYDSSTGMLS